MVVKTLSLLFHNSPAKRTMFALREIVLFVCTYVIELGEKLYVDLSAKFPDFTQAEIEVSRTNKGGYFICCVNIHDKSRGQLSTSKSVRWVPKVQTIVY